jgi:hypothetical protein
LIEELSTIGKRRSNEQVVDLRSVWLRTLDHAFIVVSLLRARRLSAND